MYACMSNYVKSLDKKKYFKRGILYVKWFLLNSPSLQLSEKLMNYLTFLNLRALCEIQSTKLKINKIKLNKLILKIIVTIVWKLCKFFVYSDTNETSAIFSVALIECICIYLFSHQQLSRLYIAISVSGYQSVSFFCDVQVRPSLFNSRSHVS